MTDLLTSIMEYVVARKEMITLYPNMIILNIFLVCCTLTVSFSYQSLDTPEGCHSNYFYSNRLLKEIQDHQSERFQHTFLKPVRLSYWYVLECPLISSITHLGLKLIF